MLAMHLPLLTTSSGLRPRSMCPAGWALSARRVARRFELSATVDVQPTHGGQQPRAGLAREFLEARDGDRVPVILGLREFGLAPGLDAEFRLTLDPASGPWRTIAERAAELGVGDRVATLGPLPLDALAAAYRSCSAVFSTPNGAIEKM